MAHFPPRKNQSDKISKILKLYLSCFSQSNLLLLPISTIDHVVMYDYSWFHSVSYISFFRVSIWNLGAQVPPLYYTYTFLQALVFHTSLATKIIGVWFCDLQWACLWERACRGRSCICFWRPLPCHCRARPTPASPAESPTSCTSSHKASCRPTSMAYLLELQAVHLRVHVAGKAFVWQQKLVCGSKSLCVAGKLACG